MKLITYTILALVFLWGLWRLLKPKQNQNKQNSTYKPPPTTMDIAHAHQILGLQLGADAQEIIQAHRRLMQRVHPDKGGSVALAQQINQAKLVLLKHHENN